MRFETPAGHQGQIDFAHFKVRFRCDPQVARNERKAIMNSRTILTDRIYHNLPDTRKSRNSMRNPRDNLNRPGFAGDSIS